MIAALTLLIVLTLSIAAVRAGAVALRLTGVPEVVAWVEIAQCERHSSH